MTTEYDTTKLIEFSKGHRQTTRRGQEECQQCFNAWPCHVRLLADALAASLPREVATVHTDYESARASMAALGDPIDLPQTFVVVIDQHGPISTHFGWRDPYPAPSVTPGGEEQGDEA
ncbi:hypothetical protein [Subtercola sp. YIM 133946]|uniref:hypothetical protein n=1 Tax=Subtercola sp. YIM 133946 TaxID=3118909 RepID=UPI002F959B8D